MDMSTLVGEMNRPTLAKGEAAHNMLPLPESFSPGDEDVICGRGRRCFNHIGNKKFRELVADYLESYSSAVSKLEKTYILSDIVSQVRANSPNGGFVKKDPDTERWYEVGDFLAREKTSQAFRDALHDQYKSSNSAKKKRRQAEQAVKLHRANSFTSIKSSDLADPQEPVYTANNSKFMRVNRLEHEQDLLLGELDRDLAAQFSPGEGRKFFSSQKSARSVLDLRTSAKKSPSAPAWYNRSCPNFAGNRTGIQAGGGTGDEDDGDADGGYVEPASKQNFDWFSTSTPDLQNNMGANPFGGDKSNPLLARAMALSSSKRPTSKPPLETFREMEMENDQSATDFSASVANLSSINDMSANIFNSSSSASIFNAPSSSSIFNGSGVSGMNELSASILNAAAANASGMSELSASILNAVNNGAASGDISMDNILSAMNASASNMNSQGPSHVPSMNGSSAAAPTAPSTNFAAPQQVTSSISSNNNNNNINAMNESHTEFSASSFNDISAAQFAAMAADLSEHNFSNSEFDTEADNTLSPIGDGDPHTLLATLEKLSDGLAVGGNPFEPAPFPD